MKKSILTFAIVLFGTIFIESSLAQGTINVGDMVTIKPSKNWNSGAKNPPSFIVAYPVKDSNGRVIVKGGTPVDLTADWEKKRGVGKPGSVEITFNSVRAIDGSMIPINGNYEKVGENKKGLAHGLTWGLFFTVLGPFALPCLAIKGEDVEINQSLTINTYVLNDTKIE